MRWLVVVLFAIGCGRLDFAALNDAAPDAYAGTDDGNHSGTRLKIIWDQYADGTRHHAGIYDAQRHEPCFIAAWADGNSYCAPTSDAPVFADAGCTQPLASEPSSYMPASYVITTDACEDAYTHLYEKAGPSAVTSDWHSFGPLQPCGGPNLVTNPLFDVGPEVSPSELVQLTLAHAQTTDRITTSYYTASDGFALETGFTDSVLATQCTGIQAVFGGPPFCAPLFTAGSELAVDAQCTQPVAMAPVGCPLASFSEFDAPGCSEQYFSTTTTMVTPTFLWNESTQTCVGSTGSLGVDYYALGAQVAVATLARVYDDVPGQRLQLVHYTAGAAHFADNTLYDTQLGTECAPNTTTDGVTRCAPVGATIGASFYADASCTTPINIAAVSTYSPCAVEVAPTYAARTISAGFTSVVEIHPIITPYTGALFELTPSCTASPSLYVDFYEVGPIVDPSTFVAMTTVTDP